MANDKPKKGPKRGKKTRKHGRNKAKCQRYRERRQRAGTIGHKERKAQRGEP